MNDREMMIYKALEQYRKDAENVHKKALQIACDISVDVETADQNSVEYLRTHMTKLVRNFIKATEEEN